MLVQAYRGCHLLQVLPLLPKFHINQACAQIVDVSDKCYDFEQFRLYSRDCNSRFCIWVLKG